MDKMDCGPCCLKIIAAYYGRRWPLDTLRELCYITKEGVTLSGICHAAETMGFRNIGVRLTVDQLCQQAKLPCIAHWNRMHFVVIYKIQMENNRLFFYVSDPSCGLLKYSYEQFCRAWLDLSGDKNCGVALLLEPTPLFYKQSSDANKTISNNAILKYLKPYKKSIVKISIGMLIGSMLSLIMPFLSQFVIDVGIGKGDKHFVLLILLAQMGLVLGQLVNELIRNRIMLHMTTGVSISMISDFLAKLMRLHIAFFDSKNTGDIMQRIGDHSRIQAFLTGSLLSSVIAVVTLVVYSIVMGFYDIKILLVFLVGSLIYVSWVLLFMNKRRKFDYMRFQESSINQSNLIQIVGGMQEIKINNCEKSKRLEWERIQEKLYTISVKSLSLGQKQQIGGTFIDQFKNVFISFISASAVIDGSITLGMMTAVQYIIGQLNAPISQFISFVRSAQDAKISFERLSEIKEREDEENENSIYIDDIPKEADIEMKNVTFQYNGPYSERVLNQVNIYIPHNKITAIVGSSGGGKTTILKLLLGFYQPVEGVILLGGQRLENYRPSSWRKNYGAVMQEGFIFSDSIQNNISLCDELPDMEKVIQSAKVANIDTYISELPLGYNTQIGSSGHGLSMGQKQRLLIARAAYKSAPYLFLDEATNSLDANNEAVIMSNLHELFHGRTVVVIAHRLSTVMNADNIIVLDRGRVVEQGNHEYLINKKSYYYRLVKNQINIQKAPE